MSLLGRTQGSQLQDHTYGIAYNNRTSLVDAQSASSMVGTYYVVLAMAPGKDPDDEYERSFTLAVDAVGEVKGAPENATVKPTTGNDVAKQENPSATSSDDGNAIRWLPIGLGIVGVLIVGMAGG